MATTASVTVDAAPKVRLSDLAKRVWKLMSSSERSAGSLRLMFRFERGVPAFPRHTGAPVLTVQDVEGVTDGPVA